MAPPRRHPSTLPSSFPPVTLEKVPPETCPNCGADVPLNAHACPGCGADERTGWSERAHADNLGLPDDEFDYDDFVQEEFGGGRAKPRGLAWYWWAAAAVVLLGFLTFLF